MTFCGYEETLSVALAKKVNCMNRIRTGSVVTSHHTIGPTVYLTFNAIQFHPLSV